MKDKMTRNEFINSFAIDDEKINEINEELDSKDIKELKTRLKYVEDNYDGQCYMYFALKEVNNFMISNYNRLFDVFSLRKDAVNYLLKAFSFGINFMPDKLPEHAYDYMKSNANVLIYNLIDEYRLQGVD